MKKSIEMNEIQMNDYILELYNCFETGYKFEEFVKYYLEKIGLDEVVITPKSRDGGKDLTAIRPGIANISSSDTVYYYIQCKRHNPNSSISVKSIRELKGIIPFGQKGIFITTAKFSKEAVQEANNDVSKPIVLIDGKSLIESCLEYEIGFVFVPKFKSELISNILNKEIVKLDLDNEDEEYNIKVEKNITANDIRARIMRIPTEILNVIDDNTNVIKIKLGYEDIKEYSYNKSGKFISGVSKFFKDYNIIDELGIYYPSKAIWTYDGTLIKVEGVTNDE